MTETILPVGVLYTHEDGLVTVRLPPGRPERKKLRAWLDRLTAVNSRVMLLPRRFIERPFGIELEYPDESRKLSPVSAKLAEWGSDLPAALPQILSLGRFALTAAEELAEKGVQDVRVSPAFVRFLPGGIPTWRLLPAPVGEAVLADWARAEADAWLWSAPPALLGGRANDPVHALGAALHHALVGALFAETLSKREKFGRLLRSRIGIPARIEAAVRSSLPDRCGRDADALTALILVCLHPRDGKRPALAVARKRFEELEKKFSPEALAQLWESEKRPDVAARLLQLLRPPEPPKPVPLPPGDCWSDTAKRLRDQGDLTGALEAAWNAVTTEGPAYCRLYLGIVQQLGARFPRPLAELTAAIERLTKAFGPQLDESSFLHIVHLRTRYLGIPTTELGGVERPYESRWNEGVSLLLRASLQIREGKAYGQVSRLCKEGRMRFEATPEGGGATGAYARAYLNLIDGIAHIGYVSSNGNVEYYADALDCFMRCYDLASRVDAEELVRASFRWFGWLARLTCSYPDPPLAQVYLGVKAILQSHGLLAEEMSARGVPEIPAYDEARLFPL